MCPFGGLRVTQIGVTHAVKLCREVLAAEAALIQQILLHAISERDVLSRIAWQIIGGTCTRAEVEPKALVAIQLRDARFHALTRSQRETHGGADKAAKAATLCVDTERGQSLCKTWLYLASSTWHRVHIKLRDRLLWPCCYVGHVTVLRPGGANTYARRQPLEGRWIAQKYLRRISRSRAAACTEAPRPAAIHLSGATRCTSRSRSVAAESSPATDAIFLRSVESREWHSKYRAQRGAVSHVATGIHEIDARHASSRHRTKEFQSRNSTNG